MVDMQLRNHVAQCRDIELVCMKYPFKGNGQLHGFVQQAVTIGMLQFMNFTNICASRHQDEPGVSAVVHQQKPGKREIADSYCIGRELRME